MKKRVIVGTVAILAALVASVMLYRNNDSSADNVADNQLTLGDQQSPIDQQSIERGKYIARAGDCVACHTAPESQHPFAGGYAITTPFGEIYTSNITPDNDTGIGRWTERDFFKAVRHGKGIDGENLYPAMPYNAYVKISDQDMHDLWQYLRTVKPVKNQVPDTELPFPYNIRLAMVGWNLLFFKNQGYVADSSQSAQWNRGAYLVAGLEHCGTCHTPKNSLGGDTNAYLQGSNLGAWYAPEITANTYTGIGQWSQQQIVDYLKLGSNHVAVASGPMAEAVTNSTQYLTVEDLTAIATYLKSTPGSDRREPAAIVEGTQMKMGENIYAANCAACHNSNGRGIPNLAASLANNPAIVASDPSSIITTVLQGGRGAVTLGNPTSAAMPSFAWKLSDEQVAAVSTYIRNSWGNAASAVPSEDITQRRQLLKLPPQMAEH